VSCLELDRISPTQRPTLGNSGTQRWTELLFVHWTYPIDVVRPLIPKEIELDPWDGRMYVGLVPFRMHAIRPWWLPRAMALDFLELNMRTYVHYRGRPAVWFFSLEASSWLAVKAARTGWSLPYFHADMSVSREGSKVAYRSRRKDSTGGFDVGYEIGDALGPSQPGTLAHFLLERYLLLSVRRGIVLEGQVHHTPYPAHAARIDHVEQELLVAAGLPRPETGPAAVHFSPGVDVEVFGPWPVKR
jgi:uncharacterized protein YqjF (DUF2071 family)